MMPSGHLRLDMKVGAHVVRKCLVPYGLGRKYIISQQTPDLSEPHLAFWLHSLREAIVGHKICGQARLEEAYA